MSYKPDPKQRPCIRKSTKAMVAHINATTRIPIRTIRNVLHSQYDFITEMLCQNEQLVLPKIGKFVIKTRKARTLTNAFGTHHQKECRWITFRASEWFRKNKLNPKTPPAP